LPGVTIGSLSGDGFVFLGANDLTVGSNNSQSTFTGVIADGGGNGGTLGSLTKVGSGTLSLTGLNSYTGGTSVNGGTLLAMTKGSSALGSGSIVINSGGTLGGTSDLASQITVASGGLISPGKKGPGRLSTQSELDFDSGSAFRCKLSTADRKADQLVANGVTIANGAHLAFVSHGQQTLPLGTVFVVIKNTSRDPILGSFRSHPEGSTFTAGGNNYEVSYIGGDGNDMTLTVVQ